MRPIIPSFLLLPILAGCAAIPQPGGAPPPRPTQDRTPPATRPLPPVTPVFRAPQLLRAPGLEGVVEQNAASLQRLFGTPRLDVVEGDMHKLQFAGKNCVLDVFLYPLRAGSEPVATHLEARNARDGQPVDRAACVAALRRR